MPGQQYSLANELPFICAKGSGAFVYSVVNNTVAFSW